MYDLRPPYVLMTDEVTADSQMKRRAARLINALPAGTPIHTCSLDELPEITLELGWDTFGGRMGMPAPTGDPCWFFGRMRFDDKLDEHVARWKSVWGKTPGFLRALYGYDAFQWFTSGMGEVKLCEDHICRPAWRIHLTRGCPHKCFYCSLRNPMTLMMNVEEYIDKLGELSRQNRFQKTWLYEDDSEALAPEPEYGGLPAVMDFCAGTEDNYVIVHTKSANVDWLRDYPHGGRTILVWSLTGPTQSRQMEPGSADTYQRIEAAAKCHEWGYTTRFKFKPIVPVKGWRDELGEMIKLVCERTSPDVISLFTLAWMDYAEMVQLVDTDLLDPRFLTGARDAAEALGKTKVRPFPHELRKEVYAFCIDEIRRYNQAVPISLCTESLQMWRELGPKIGLDPANYPCGCGPQATPNLLKLEESPWAIAAPQRV